MLCNCQIIFLTKYKWNYVLCTLVLLLEFVFVPTRSSHMVDRGYDNSFLRKCLQQPCAAELSFFALPMLLRVIIITLQYFNIR